MSLKPNVVGYHTNDANRCRLFVDQKTSINSPDIHYFGWGMYFWDNLSNAKYWVRKKRTTIAGEIWIVKANICIEQLLDLSDNDILDFIDKLWSEYCRKKGCSSAGPLGKKIDALFDFFPMLSANFEVIKGYGGYSKQDKVVEFLEGSYVVNNVKCIYCVRYETAILHCELEEVIQR